MNPSSNIHIGTDAMGSKSKKQAIIKNNSIVMMQVVESAKEC
jgi:hypothetical protein